MFDTQYQQVKVAKLTDDPEAILEALHMETELQPREDELGNPQAVVRLDSKEDGIYAVVPDAVDPAVVTGAVDTHYATALAARQEEEQKAATMAANAATIRQRLLDGIKTADSHITTISGASPTAAQQKAALLFCLNGIKALARLELRALDSAD